MVLAYAWRYMREGPLLLVGGPYDLSTVLAVNDGTNFNG